MNQRSFVLILTSLFILLSSLTAQSAPDPADINAKNITASGTIKASSDISSGRDINAHNGTVTAANLKVNNTTISDNVTAKTITTTNINASNGVTTNNLAVGGGNLTVGTNLTLSNVGDIQARNVTTNNVSATNVSAATLTVQSQKVCWGVSAGSFRMGTVVPSTWSVSTCQQWATVGAAAYQLGCIFKDSFSNNPKLNDSTPPSPNCGW